MIRTGLFADVIYIPPHPHFSIVAEHQKIFVELEFSRNLIEEIDF